MIQLWSPKAWNRTFLVIHSIECIPKWILCGNFIGSYVSLVVALNSFSLSVIILSKNIPFLLHYLHHWICLVAEIILWNHLIVSWHLSLSRHLHDENLSFLFDLSWFNLILYDSVHSRRDIILRWVHRTLLILLVCMSIRTLISVRSFHWNMNFPFF